MYETKKTISSPIVIMPRKGAFGFTPKTAKTDFKYVRWTHCREVFHRYWNTRDTNLFICHNQNKGKVIAAFIKEAELRLGLKKFSEFGPTQFTAISWGQVSTWWTTSKIKKQFLTVLIRAGANYSLKTKDFNAALYSIEFTKNTRPAVERFFSGYNRYIGNSNGWYSAFCYCGPMIVKSLLIK